MPISTSAQNDSIIGKINILNFNYYQSINKNPKSSLNYAKEAFSYHSKIQSPELKFKVAANYTTALFINEYYNEALSVLNLIDPKNILDNNKALYFTLRGLIENDLNHYTQAEENYKNALKLYIKLKDKDNEFTILNNLGLLYNNIGDYKRSLEFYLKCYEIIQNLEIKVDRYKYYSNVGTVSYNLNDYNDALNSFNSALAEAKINSDTIRIFRAHEKLAQTNVALNYLDTAISHYEKTLKIYEEVGLQKNVCNILLRLGDIYYSQDKKNIAFNLYNKCQTIALKNSYSQEEFESSLNLGTYYQEIYSFKKACFFYEKIINNSSKIINIEIVKKAYYSLYEIKKEQKNNYKSLAYLEYFLSLDKTINERQLVSLKDQIEIQYNLKQKESELENLQINYNLNELKLKNRKQQINGLIILSILIAVVFILVLIFYLQKRKTQRILSLQNNKINLQNQKLISTNTEIKSKRKELSNLNSVKDQLLSIIAHDVKSPMTDLNNLLFILRHNIESLNTTELKKNLAIIESNNGNLLNLLNNILNWTISQSNGIKVNYSNFIINELIQANINQTESSAVSKEISVNYINKSEIIKITSDFNIINFAFRNILSNALKFTNKNGEVNIKVSKTDKSIIIQVADNGIGFDENIHNLLKGNPEKVPTISGTEREKGYGIGLSLCLKMLIEINSTIEYEKNTPNGSIFSIHINIDDF